MLKTKNQAGTRTWIREAGSAKSEFKTSLRADLRSELIRASEKPIRVKLHPH